MTAAPGGFRGLNGDVAVYETPEQLAGAAVDLVAGAAREAVDARGEFSIALAGGTTPRLLYQALARPPWRDAMPWPAWRVYFGDERACPPDDESSNYRMAHEALLDHVPIAAAQVHRMPGDAADLDAAAGNYAAMLEQRLPRGPGGAPRLDCVLLGLGENGHTASLFPGTPALLVRDRWVVRGRADYPPFDRLTLTYPALNAAALVMFLVTGHAKRDAIRATAAGQTPAARVLPLDGTLRWLLDRAAAGEPTPSSGTAA
jgi:6-phosphogluconolactonase